MATQLAQLAIRKNIEVDDKKIESLTKTIASMQQTHSEREDEYAQKIDELQQQVSELVKGLSIKTQELETALKENIDLKNEVQSLKVTLEILRKDIDKFEIINILLENSEMLKRVKKCLKEGEN